MSKVLFSQSWYRVAPLKPKLGSHVEIHRHSYRNQDWFILQDHLTGRHHRFSLEAYHIIGLMDGRRTLGDIWEAACTELGDHMPTQDEVINLLSQLHRADLLQPGVIPDISDLRSRHLSSRQSRFLMNLRSPMSVRFPLLNPDRVLNRTMPLVRPLLGWAGALIWMAVVLSALVLVGLHWKDLYHNVNDQILSLQNLAMIGLIYPVVKVLHEFGHAYMVKRWGGEVPEMGIMLLVLMPIPYVEASSSLSFRSKRQRIMVAAAGILVELFLAAVAMLVWANVEPGAVRAAAFNLMLVAGISTLLFNGNPLLRFDAYYILSDYLEIPNLSVRGNRYIIYLLQKYLLGIKGLEEPQLSPGERAWLASYAVAAFFYRVYISFRIILFIAGKYFVVGIVLALWACFSMIVSPLQKGLLFLIRGAPLQRSRRRVIPAVLIPTALLASLLFLCPLPLYTIAEGVVWAPKDSKIHASVDGFVRSVLTPSGSPVTAGTPLVQCEDPELDARLKILQARRSELDARHQISKVQDLAEAQILEETIRQIEAELAQLKERIGELTIRSTTDGTFVLPDERDIVGRFVHRGTPLGYVVDREKTLIRVVVPQADIARVRTQTQQVTVRLAERLDQALPAKIARQVPAATHQLPSLALSLDGGGPFALDPARSEPNSAFESLFQLDLLLEKPLADKLEERVYVRFEHAAEPLARRWYQSLRRLFLNRFDI